MSNHLSSSVWLIGVGPMAHDYVPVLQELGADFKVIGRGSERAESFAQKTNVPVLSGGIEKALATGDKPKRAIVCVGVHQLLDVTKTLINAGIPDLLIEKPAGLNTEEVIRLRDLAQQFGTRSRVAYNRRYYDSVLAAKKIIDEDGGATSFHFEFTERSYQIEPLDKPMEVKQAWILANSSHVMDLAFFLGGKPKQMSCKSQGELSWHKAGAIFTGFGTSETGCPFSYHANWISPGGWGVDVRTKNRRIVLQPLEELKVQEIGKPLSPLALEPSVASKFKPGLYLQIRDFLTNAKSLLPDLKEQAEFANLLDHIARGKSYG